MLDPVNTVREWSLLSNPRTPASVTSSIRHEALDLKAASSGSEAARLAKLSSYRVLNITTPLLSAEADTSSIKSSVLAFSQKAQFRAKFGFVSGSWCCAPQEEAKKGAPRSAHFSLMNA